ncbi:DeoR/GlpR family DNA-binding transcription regulator [Acidocella sp. KAb 2-4]|uniref:DeoR/GlpR family DNA-binding transcription regulator n=1 Tax=Acidocella sp. KAb 2-4 TaxID=2885158 RepID=UPI001D07E48D|nr:DeoR/GlpR family DNA-binding transcription regulator [Acidocella sp. KAb 2-4]MCB5943469.1 DeoR/GlpR family DNA-binding transcription regulator [Acidocella sp. KAb 2-4]
MSLKRQSDILQVVRESGSASITDLAARLGVSTETIRRNLKPLIAQGSVLRFHGGIMSPEHMDDPPFQRRMQLNRNGKRQVAALVLGMVRDGDTLILDNGTTATYVAEALTARANLVVVTNSAQIACRLANRNNNRVFMAGGELGGDDAAAFGPASIEFLKQFEVRCALITVAGINARSELVDFHLFEAEFSRAAMAQAAESWVITDHSKFGREAPVKVCELAQVQKIVTDAAPPEEFAARCAAAGVQLVTG